MCKMELMPLHMNDKIKFDYVERCFLLRRVYNNFIKFTLTLIILLWHIHTKIVIFHVSNAYGKSQEKAASQFFYRRGKLDGDDGFDMLVFSYVYCHTCFV